MGQGSSNNRNGEQDEGFDASNNVDIQLMEQQIADLFKFKILLLGAGESGKSTIVKQMELIHKQKKSPKELKMVALSLHQNIIDCMKALLHACKNFEYDSQFDETDQAAAEQIYQHDENERISPEFGEAILRLYKSEALQNTFGRKSEFWILDSFDYYIDNIMRFCEPDFLPSEEDVIMARIRTTGIVVTELEHKIKQDTPDDPESLKFQIVDVGGQRNERKKWIHCFDDVRAVLFIVNLAGYNQVLFEDSNKNRMIEELELFQNVTHNKIFANTPIFLFLNKKDLFEKMVQDVDMKKTFSDYDGGKHVLPALEYIQHQFKKTLPPGKDVQIQVLSSKVKIEVKMAFEEVKKTLFDMNKKSIMENVAEIRKQMKKCKKNEGSSSSSRGTDVPCCNIRIR